MLIFSYVLNQDINEYLSISSSILLYQAKNNYVLSQDINKYLSISSPILLYQPIRNQIVY
jgi:hypothetical protein